MKYLQKDYIERTYRASHEGQGLKYFTVKVQESDLAIAVDEASFSARLEGICTQKVMAIRTELEEYIRRHPQFRTSFDPIKLLPLAPPHAALMADAARRAGVGPMAAVAGTFAQAVGEELLKFVREVIVENGGDIYLSSSRERVISVFAGDSKFSNRVGIKVSASESSLGICTSSGTVGPSISLGLADAVVIKGKSAALADAVASGAANRVQTSDDLMKAVEYAREIRGITGILAIKDDRMAVWGEMELLPLQMVNHRS